MIHADKVGVSFDAHRILDAITLTVHRGEILALVGPNGAGKSTLLSVLSGDRKPETGSVSFDGHSMGDIRYSELAKLRAVLTQENSVSFPFRVSEIVAMGRSPWARSVHSRDDVAAVSSALAATDVAHLSARRYTTLSGGEKARVSLARVLAQETPAVFLDEPTASLDLRHQEDVMQVAKKMAANGRAVVIVLHDLSLAGAYADRLALIANGTLNALGTPAEVLTAERIERVYGLPVDLHTVGGRPVVVPHR